MILRQKQIFRMLADLLEDKLAAELVQKRDDEDENMKKCVELTERVISFLYKASAE